MKQVAILWVGLSSVFAGQAAAAGTLTGEMAAYIDWGVKNCDGKSTDTEHKLVEEVTSNEKSKAAFQSAYLKQYQAKDFTDANANGPAMLKMCATIKEWFGPSGSKMPNLIIWTKSGVSDSPRPITPQQAAGNKSGAGRGVGGH